MTREAYIYDSIRTPRGRGKKDGALYEVKPVTLLANLLNSLAERNNLDTAQVDDVIIGCVTPVGDQGMVIAKTAVMAAGWDEKVAGVQLDRFCASGLEAVNIAAAKIRAGWEDIIVAGGVESMSRVAMGSDGGAWMLDPETSIKTGFVAQGIGADLVATLEGFSREEIDAFALNSHIKATEAENKGYFSRSVVPVKDRNGFLILSRDEVIRHDASLENLAKLKPSFETMGKLGFDAVALGKYPQIDKINHIHTPGNSSAIVDGSAVILIASEEKGKKLNLKPRGRIVATAVTATDPTIMLVGPTPAAKKALARAGLNASDIDLYEVNEAFASVVMKFKKDMDIPFEKINVNGGAIAMGHPLGASGAILVGTVLDELERRKLRYGLITLCAGGGMGIATIIERV